MPALADGITNIGKDNFLGHDRKPRHRRQTLRLTQMDSKLVAEDNLLLSRPNDPTPTAQFVSFSLR